ncbi:glycosyltransferase family 32 protein [Paenibacillus gansuensis]|uniref:Glycosyltransferase family 32 protein n=1 Tax=Paenibacillus gansuensis TaxID=306542 RepID=A0ABW5PFY0_9BACL
MKEEAAGIPRIIHYCWFGRGAKPPKIVKCMNSWRRHLPDYELVEWNEDNFDLNANRFVKEAYASRKYAFVSDYVRLHALFAQGGIYLDTDVEILKPLDRFLHHESFFGYEDEQYASSCLIGSVKEHPWMEELKSYYEELPFVLPDGTLNMKTNTSIITRLCEPYGFAANGEYQVLTNGVVFYPRTYFSPYDFINGANYITENSYAIHHFAKSWLPYHVRLRGELKRRISRLAGPAFIGKMRRVLWNK